MKSLKLGITAAALALAGCTGAFEGSGGLGGGGGGRLDNSCTGADFGATEAANKLETFLASTGAFLNAAADLDQGLTQACLRMGNDLGVPADQMQPTGDTPAVRAAC